MKASEEHLAFLFIKQVNNERYGNLKKTFVNDGLKGNMTHTKYLEAAVLILEEWKPTGTEKQNQDNAAAAKNEAGVLFAQPGTGKLDKHSCYGCDKRGHHMRECPNITQEEKQEICADKK